MLKKMMICLSLPAVLAGCANVTVQAPSPEALLPPGYQNISTRAERNLDRHWWRIYHDATLDTLVETTLRDNPYTQVSHLRLIAARARSELANADRQPQLGAGLGFSNARTSVNTPLGEVLGHNTISGNKYTAGFEAAWQLDVWNRVAYAVEAATASVAAEQAFAGMVEQVLSWEVAVSYWQYRLAESDLALLTAIRQQRAESETLLNGRFDAGLISELEPARARLALRDADVEIEEASKRLRLAEHELATLAVKPIAEFTVPHDAGYRLPEVPDISPGLPASILRHRPDLAQSAQNIRALSAQKAIADTAFYPSISLTGNFGFASMDLRNLSNIDSRQFSLGPIAISLPILDGGRIRASQKIADARYQEAVNVHKVQLLIALREVDDALTEVQAYQRQAEPLQAALASARHVSRVAKARYDKGAINYLDVANAEIDLAAVELKCRRNHLRRLQASTQLAYVLGGGWHDDASEQAR